MDLASARERFDRLIEQAKSACARGRYLDAASFVQIAAKSAWLRHSGQFYSAEAEMLLKDISVHVIKSRSGKSAPILGNVKHQRVLHVLTQAYHTGGHSRLVWRWINADVDREHHIALTQQGTAPWPSQLEEAATKSGGNLFVLDNRRNLLEIARALRQIASAFDFIILHVHPSDVVPHLAWSGDVDHPPIAYLNHADHVFWLGGLLCDTNVNIREAGLRLSAARRGIPVERNSLLPIPLQDRSRKRNARLEAKRDLSLSSDDFVALTIAAAYKFSPMDEVDFVKIHLPLLEREKRLRLVVVGPSPKDPYWENWAKSTNGRVQAVGEQNNIETFLSAADIYLDSTPIGSLTSLLEAALAEIPCVSWHPHSPKTLAAMLSCDDVAIDGFPVAFAEHVQYLRHIEYLMTQPAEASKLAKDIRNSVVDKHASKNWRVQLEIVYEHARTQVLKRPHATLKENLGEVGEYDRILLRSQMSDRTFIESLPRSLSLYVRLRHLRANNASSVQILRALIPTAGIKVAKAVIRGPLQTYWQAWRGKGLYG